MLPPTIQAVSLLRNEINDCCIFRVPEGSCELPSMVPGEFYSWQFYLRSVLLNAAHLKTICQDFWARYGDAYKQNPFQISGVESAASPIIAALILYFSDLGYKLNAFTIRKERKSYGRGNLIEGRPNNLPVLLVDDLTSASHKTFWHAVDALNLHSLKIYNHAYVLVRKEPRCVNPIINTVHGGIQVQSMFTLNDFSLEYETHLQEILLMARMENIFSRL